MNNVIKLYTDGGCRGNGCYNNNGIPCACGLIIADECDNILYKTGVSLNFSRGNTNNKAEIYGVILGITKALEVAAQDKELVIYSDSAYTLNGISTWIYSWQKNGWVTAKREPVKNKELWMKLYELVGKAKQKFLAVSYVQVKGHADNKLNNECDAILNLAMDKQLNHMQIIEEELV